MTNKETHLSKWDKVMMAITFAEVGEPETAIDILQQTSKKQKRLENQAENRPDLRV
jgi:hypothetical protein